FYGRDEEKTELRDPQGGAFLYGGRQLGKTVLLRHLVDEYHDPEQGRLFLYADLTEANLTDPANIWQEVLVPALREHGVGDGMASHWNQATIADAIVEWLDEDETRRIVIFLDEADAFLSDDERDDYTQCSRLKALKDETRGRFKPVLAGLHNVQRATTQANNQLAHFGEPICVGPFDRAENLIEEPLAALGYVFEDRALSLRLAAQTLHYPSLMQMAGKHLLRHMRERIDGSEGPPFVIQRRHVEELEEELEEQIEAKFNLTLDLDERYKFLAYLLLYLVREKPDVTLEEGVSVGVLRQEAEDWTGDDFDLGDRRYLETLLEEMVELGVLRRTDGRTTAYTFASSTVLNLLPSGEELAEKLVQNWRLPAHPTPAETRLRPEDYAENPRRSPFTVEQFNDIASEADRHGLALVAGTWLAGEFIAGERPERFLGRVPEGCTEVGEFADWLERATDSDERRDQGWHVAYVPSSVPWDEEWWEAGRARVEGLRSPRSLVRLVFEADASRAHGLLVDGSLDVDSFENPSFERVSLRPWTDTAVRRWLTKLRFDFDDSQRETLESATGYWGRLLVRAAETLDGEEGPDTPEE
ncbi:MAG: ATP-binding protein, partial [Bradymonadaceae bacterium]